MGQYTSETCACFTCQLLLNIYKTICAQEKGRCERTMWGCRRLYIFIVLSMQLYFWLSFVWSQEWDTTVFCMHLITLMSKCGVTNICVVFCISAKEKRAMWSFFVYFCPSFSKCTWTGPLLQMMDSVCFLWRPRLLSQYGPAHGDSCFWNKNVSCIQLTRFLITFLLIWNWDNKKMIALWQLDTVPLTPSGLRCTD